jgi:hypothetical protein
MPLDSLELADSVAVTFEMQKNDQKNKTVIHGRTDDPILCPVKQWARLVNRIWTYPGTTEDTSVCTVWHHGRCNQITLLQVITTLRAACATIGSARLGFEPDEIGTHSLRSAPRWKCTLQEFPFTLSCSLADGPVMLSCVTFGDKSSSFQKTSQKMLTHRSFHTIPDVAPRVVLNDDPRQRNHRDNAKTRRNIGRDTSRWVQLPAISLFN